MVRNSLFHSALLLALLCSGLAGAPAEARRPAPDKLAALEQGRALWVKRDQLKTRERAAAMVDDAADAGYNVLFLQIRGRGDAGDAFGAGAAGGVAAGSTRTGRHAVGPPGLRAAPCACAWTAGARVVQQLLAGCRTTTPPSRATC